MPLPTRPLTVTICDSDIVARAALSKLAEEHGFEVLDSVENGPRLLQSLDYYDASLVILNQELYGMSGLEVIEDMSRREHPPESILITSDEAIRDHAREFAVIGVPNRGDTDALIRTIRDAKHLFETGERRSKHDRRSGVERRQTQDWSKVISERRSGEDRRKNKRRREDADGENRRDEQSDRRQKQEWGKVTMERRSGLPRRTDEPER